MRANGTVRPSDCQGALNSKGTINVANDETWPNAFLGALRYLVKVAMDGVHDNHPPCPQACSLAPIAHITNTKLGTCFQFNAELDDNVQYENGAPCFWMQVGTARLGADTARNHAQKIVFGARSST